jgi:hypothetical protein
MNWYKLSQKDLSQDIARLLISAENNSGQFNYNSFLNKITSQIIDQKVFDIALKRGISLALKLLKITEMTTGMQEVVEQIRYNFKAEAVPAQNMPSQNEIDEENGDLSGFEKSPKLDENLADVEVQTEEKQNAATTKPTNLL